MLQPIRAFLSAALQDDPSSVDALARSLDDLAVAYANAPPGDPSDDMREPPERDYRSTCELIRKRFPDLGHYGVAAPLVLNVEGWMFGDAMDDIADIVADVSQVLWRYETIGFDDACWYFRFGFETHWGRHLRELQLFLHAKRFGHSTGTKESDEN